MRRFVLVVGLLLICGFASAAVLERVTIESLEAITGWTYSTDLTGVTVDTAHRGVGSYSLEFDKTATTDTTMDLQKTITSINLGSVLPYGNINYWVYLSSISAISTVYTAVGTDVDNNWRYTTEDEDLIAGWNYITHDFKDVDTQTGNGADVSAITWVAFSVEFDATTDTLNDMRLDNLTLAKVPEDKDVCNVAGPITTAGSAAQIVKASAGKILGVTLTATAATATCKIYDHASAGSGTQVVDLAVAVDSNSIVLGPMLKAINCANGIYVVPVDASIMVYYE